MDEFAEALDLADKVYLCDIFGSAREEQGNVKIEDLGAKIKKVEKSSKKIMYLHY